MDRRLRIGLAAVVLAKLLDGITTWLALQQPYVYEYGPLTRELTLSYGVTVGVAIGTAVALVGSIFLVVLADRVWVSIGRIGGLEAWGRRLSLTAAGALAMVYLYFAAVNISNWVA